MGRQLLRHRRRARCRRRGADGRLVARLGWAATRATGAQRVFVGRDTRASGLALEAALSRGLAAAGASAVLGGVLPTAAIALGSLHLGAAITASHNPPAYNGVKFFHAGGTQALRRRGAPIEALLDGHSSVPREGPQLGRVPASATSTRRRPFGSDLAGLRLVVDCANGAYAGLAPRGVPPSGSPGRAIGDEPDGSNINAGRGAADPALLRATVLERDADLGHRLRRRRRPHRRASTSAAHWSTATPSLAVLALDLGVDRVCVTRMTNLGFHELMARPRGSRRDHRRRRPLRPRGAAREGGVLGGEQSGHVIYLDGHVAGDGLTAGLLVCAALQGGRSARRRRCSSGSRRPPRTSGSPRGSSPRRCSGGRAAARRARP